MNIYIILFFLNNFYLYVLLLISILFLTYCLYIIRNKTSIINSLTKDKSFLKKNLDDFKSETNQQKEELLIQQENILQHQNYIKKQKAILEAIYNGISDAIFIMNKNSFVDCNNATLKIFDCKRNEIIGHHPKEFSPEYQSNGTLSSELSKKYIEKTMKGEPQIFEWEHITKKGKLFIAQVSLNKINIDNEDLIVAVVRDFTEKAKQIEQLNNLNEELKTQQNLLVQTTEKLYAKNQEIIQSQNELNRAKVRFETIFNSASDGIILISNNKFIDCNPASEHILKYNKEQIIGNNLLNISPKYQPNGLLSEDYFNNKLKEAKETGIVRFEWDFLNSNNEKRIAKISISKAKINRKTIYVLIIRDITEEKIKNIKLKEFAEELKENQEELRQQNEELKVQAEELAKQRDIIEQEKEKAKQASKYKSLFLASMSHEIRTPLNGIIGMLNLLKDTSLTNKQKEFVDTIDVSSKSLLDIINDLLDYSKIEANQLHLESIPINIEETFNEAVRILQFKAKEKGLTLKMNFDNKLHKYYKADPVRLKQILINYCNNAIKFTSKGGVTINVYELERKEKTNKIKVEVKDTGIGISKENIKKLFKEFSQVDNSISRKFGGTGLGLAISMKLANMMNGEVGVESEEGKGSTFWFTAELELINNIELKQKTENIKTTKNLKILLVEDNKINQRVAIYTLQKNNHKVDVANDGIEAIEKYKKNHDYDVILMDIQMPNMNGYEATKEIRKYERENNIPATKIVAMTANAMKGEKEKCLDIGMDAYISKPFTKEDLFNNL